MCQPAISSWQLFGDCGEIRCEAHRSTEGFELAVLNEGALLSVEWVYDLPSLLNRSSEVRQKLKQHGFRERPMRHAALLGGPSWGPAKPSTALVGCLAIGLFENSATTGR
jgi:hypothetical protein